MALYHFKINSLITNESTGIKTFIDLFPHINLIDNFHYARNISLPGKIDDYYKVEFTITLLQNMIFYFTKIGLINMVKNFF